MKNPAMLAPMLAKQRCTGKNTKDALKIKLKLLTRGLHERFEIVRNRCEVANAKQLAGFHKELARVKAAAVMEGSESDNMPSDALCYDDLVALLEAEQVGLCA
jgi:hypothetical protein